MMKNLIQCRGKPWNQIAYLSHGGLSPLVLVCEDAEGDDPEHPGDQVLEVEHGVVSPTVGRPLLDADVADDGGHHLDGQLRLVVPHQLVHMDRENRHQTVQLGPSERSGMVNSKLFLLFPFSQQTLPVSVGMFRCIAAGCRWYGGLL